MKSKTVLATAAVSLAAILCSAPAQAKDSRTYFTARMSQSPVPQQLSQAERERYRSIFAAINGQRWDEVQTLLAQDQGGLLKLVAEAEYFTHANSPRVELAQIESWFARGGRNLPQADQLARIAMTRGAERAPDTPYLTPLRQSRGFPRRDRPDTVYDPAMPAEIASAIQQAISNDSPDSARLLLDGVDAGLGPAARAEWRQKVAWSYFIENRDAEALAMARTVSGGSGAWVAEGEWVAGLAAWRLGDCNEAGEAFRRAAFGAINPELRSASLYWGSRAALRCRQPELAAQLLNDAARADETLYGMLAAEQLGRETPDRYSQADLSRADWQQISDLNNVRVATALAEMGEDTLASEILIHQSRLGPSSHYAALSRLARELSLPRTQLYMAYNAPSGSSGDPAAAYPAPRWMPATGWQVDPALAYAHILQESAFRAEAVSPASAQGLMQIMPIAVREHAPSLGMSSSGTDIFDPATNLAFGQRHIMMLRDDPATGGRLPKIMAAYNAGMTPVRRWNSEIKDQGDPLLYMEAIPYWETRGYVAVVMRNYWNYERQAGAASPSRVALAQNAWPLLGDGSGPNGRVYMSAGTR